MSDRRLVFVACLAWTAVACTMARAGDLDRGKIKQQLITHEGKRTKAYRDTEGIPTVGVGFNLTRADAKKKIEGLGLDYEKVKAGRQELSEEQIDKLLEGDIDAALADCKAVFPKFGELSDVRQRVLVDMMFNLGRARFEKFERMIARVKEGDFAKAADEMKASKWYEQVKSRGKRLEGMMRTDRDAG